MMTAHFSDSIPAGFVVFDRNGRFGIHPVTELFGSGFNSQACRVFSDYAVYDTRV